MRCATHPKVETTLRCGKCGKAICPKCLVQTPVGARCPDCAKLYKLPTYSVPIQYYLRAVGAGLFIAVICGIIWGVIVGLVPFFYLNLLLAPAVGYAIREVVSLAVNRKRGIGLAIIGGIGVVISYLISKVSFFQPVVLFSLSFNPLHLVLDLAALALGIFVTVTHLR